MKRGLHLSGTYDQLGFNGNCCPRIAQIVEAYSGEGGKPLWAGVHHYESRTSAMDCIDPNLRAAVAKQKNPRGTGRFIHRGDWCLEGKVARPQMPETVLTEKEHSPPSAGAAKNGGFEAWRQRRNDCEPGQWRDDDRWPNRVPESGYGVVLDSIFPLLLVHELGPRPQERRQVRAWLRDKSHEEDVNALSRVCSGSRAPFAADSVPTLRRDLVTARVRELVDRSLPTFAIPGQRVAFLKLLRAPWRV